MSMTHPEPLLKTENLHRQLDDLQAFVQLSFHDATPLHQVEHGLWKGVLQLGRQLLQQFLDLNGTGDLGPTVVLPNNQEAERLEPLHRRTYQSIFGEFQLQRVVYGSREGQKIDFVPLDNRLQLPESEFSYLLQDWDQSLCAEQAFAQVSTALQRILNFKQHVDTLEGMNQQLAAYATSFRLNRPTPPPAEEGELVVGTADCKGIVMRRSADEPPPPAHLDPGEKVSRKKMATVGGVYTVDRYVRTPEQVLAALFRDEPPVHAQRPKPCHKQVWASLKLDEATGPTGMEAVYLGMAWEIGRRNPGQAKETVYLHDGQEELWDAQAQHLPAANSVEILELLHVTPRVWQAAHLFHAVGSDAAEAFARDRILRILQGQAAGVVMGLRQMGTKHRLTGAKKRSLGQIGGYLEKNLSRLRYHEYLAKGYPIASGVIEGACRHLVKDRMERAGMHWTKAGAQAMLEVRSLWVNGDWEAFHQYRLECETKRLYPHRERVAGAHYAMAV